MSFHEKSAWVMAVVLLPAAAWYFSIVVQASAALGETAPPVLPVVVIYVIIIIVLSIVGHILVAVTKPSEADDALDERDRIIASRAGSFSGLLLGLGVLAGLGVYLFHYDGNLLFHMVFGALMLAQLGEYGAKIVSYRRGV